jgi:hypothetical protein
MVTVPVGFLFVCPTAEVQEVNANIASNAVMNITYNADNLNLLVDLMVSVFKVNVPYFRLSFEDHKGD